MSQRNVDGMRAFASAETSFVNYVRVYVDSAGRAALAGVSNRAVGVVEPAGPRVAAVDDPVTVLLTNAPGTRKMVASGAITRGNLVYAAASGKVAATGTIVEGVALETTTANNDILEVVAMSDADVGTATTLTPNSTAGAANSMESGVSQYTVTTVTTDANDFVVLPPIDEVNIGHEIIIACNAGGNFELRTPASSNTKINDVDADGTQEYLCTDTDLIRVVKHTATGWVAQSITKLGAVRTAVVPD